MTSWQGFEVVKQLLSQTQPYRLVLGARNVAKTQAAYDQLGFDQARHQLKVAPLELADLKNTRAFAQQTLSDLGSTAIDFLVLNAAISDGSEEPGPNGSKWSEAYIVNHLGTVSFAPN